MADGSAVIEAWGERFSRSWCIEGEQVCYRSLKEVNCFTFQQSKDCPERYRVTHVTTGELTYFVLAGEDTVADSNQRDGGLTAPSAEEIAAELSNPNTAMGSMIFNFDDISYTGDLPKSGSQSRV